jgi:hypothetical protein
MGFSLDLSKDIDKDGPDWNPSRFNARDGVVNDVFEEAEELLDDAGVPFPYSEVPEEALGAEEHATGVQIANWAYKLDDNGGAEPGKAPIEQDLHPVPGLSEALGSEEGAEDGSDGEEAYEEGGGPDLSDDLSELERAKRLWDAYERGEREMPEVENFDFEGLEERKEFLLYQNSDDTASSGAESEDSTPLDDDDGPLTVDEAIERYKSDPRNVDLELLRDQLTAEQFREFEDRKGDIDNSEMSVSPPGVEPDRDPEEPLDPEETLVTEYEWGAASGVGDSTEADIIEHIDSEYPEVDTLDELAALKGFEFSDVSGVGEVTGESLLERFSEVFESPEDLPIFQSDDEEQGGSDEESAESGSQDSDTSETPESSDEGVTTLLIGVKPVKGGEDAVVLEDAVEPYKRKIEAVKDVTHFSLVDYAGWKGPLANLVRSNFEEDLEGETIIVTRPGSSFMDPVLDALIPLCDVVYDGS